MLVHDLWPPFPPPCSPLSQPAWQWQRCLVARLLPEHPRGRPQVVTVVPLCGAARECHGGFAVLAPAGQVARPTSELEISKRRSALRALSCAGVEPSTDGQPCRGRSGISEAGHDRSVEFSQQAPRTSPERSPQVLSLPPFPEPPLRSGAKPNDSPSHSGCPDVLPAQEDTAPPQKNAGRSRKT